MITRFYRIAAALFCACAITLVIPSAPAHAAPKGKSAEYKKCMQLRGCRSAYTKCFNRLEKEVKPAKWSEERDKCVVAYKACIDKHFQSGEMLFTRWFVPDENCDHYR